jgi:hypothetical protein
MTKPKLLTESESTELLDRLAPDWPLLFYDGAVIDHVLKVISNPRGPYRRHAKAPYPPGRRARRKLHGAGVLSPSAASPTQTSYSSDEIRGAPLEHIPGRFPAGVDATDRWSLGEPSSIGDLLQRT